MVPRIKKTAEEAEEIMKDNDSDHSTHLRKKEYTDTCFWCKAHGYA